MFVYITYIFIKGKKKSKIIHKEFRENIYLDFNDIYLEEMDLCNFILSQIFCPLVKTMAFNRNCQIKVGLPGKLEIPFCSDGMSKV